MAATIQIYEYGVSILQLSTTGLQQTKRCSGQCFDWQSLLQYRANEQRVHLFNFSGSNSFSRAQHSKHWRRQNSSSSSESRSAAVFRIVLVKVGKWVNEIVFCSHWDRFSYFGVWSLGGVGNKRLRRVKLSGAGVLLVSARDTGVETAGISALAVSDTDLFLPAVSPFTRRDTGSLEDLRLCKEPLRFW